MPGLAFKRSKIDRITGVAAVVEDAEEVEAAAAMATEGDVEHVAT